MPLQKIKNQRNHFLRENKNSYAKINMQCLREAAESKNIQHEQIDEYGNYLILNINNKKYHFVQYRTPFNNSSIDKLCKDKDFTHKYFNGDLEMPKEKSYINPKTHDTNKKYVIYSDINQISNDIKSTFSLPCIIKMNKGSMGRNVFICLNENEIKKALKKIYKKTSKSYDFIAVAEEFIDIKREFRIIWFKGRIIFVYEKICDKKIFNLSPLHNPNSYVKLIDEKDYDFKKIENFLCNSKKLHEIEFCGIDLVIDKSNKLKLLELNNTPSFEIFVSHLGKKPVVLMYQKILQKLKEYN